ncbi:penicillin-binding protein 2 [Thalassobacillus sp. CUG 92003]|uniref:peptidoglycan D,D-transpeptidase FtsI family protein n=1 Tax=Thalassobacillus sp. CUG 92003 TaxID=2736641 RepID=UPI0015E6CE2D|nr:penicillin-binding protein 2 [Thalassobacillus sp. CUG 92003]
MGNKKNNERKKKTHLPFRLNVLFFIIFLLFASLILQLGVVQILNGEEAQEEIDKTENQTTALPVPRGKMYDRYGRLLVDNQSLYSITYTPPKGVQAEDRLDLAKKLSQYIDKEFEDELRLRDLKEYFYLENQKEVQNRIDQEEAEDLEPGEVYQLELDSIKESEVNDYDNQTKEVIAIKKELDKAYALSPQIVKNENVTQKEYAVVGEHLNELPGIDVTSDWKREYPMGDTLSSFLGGITDRSIPRSKMEYYLSLGYSRSDRVGNSGLEEEYEDVLRGTKEKVQYTTDSDNNIVDTEVIREGERGDDLVLTFDSELQKRVNEIVRTELTKEVQRSYKNRHMEDALVVMSDPQTGEILAASGMHYNRDPDEDEQRVSNVSHKVLYDQYPPGSAIKGASVLTGLHTGVVSPGEYIYDRPLNIKGTETKSSYSQLGSVNALSALERSSNVYMFFIAMRMMGNPTFQENAPLSLEPGTFQRMLKHFHQFGLGVETGIDYPYEAPGVQGSNPGPGNLMDFMIGQYSSYTPMQLNQYVTTIANDGYRVRPHFMKEVRQPSKGDKKLGPVNSSFNTDVMNRVVMSNQYIDLVQNGFRQAFQGSQGTATSTFYPTNGENVSYSPAGKTGTAEASKLLDNGELFTELENLTLVGYAPHDDPEVAFSVMVPYVGKDLPMGGDKAINLRIGRQILDAYFELKEEREESGVDSDVTGSNNANNEDG